MSMFKTLFILFKLEIIQMSMTRYTEKWNVIYPQNRILLSNRKNKLLWFMLECAWISKICRVKKWSKGPYILSLPLYEMSREDKSIKIESKSVIAKVEHEKREWLQMGMRGLFWHDGNVLQLDCANGWTTL